jgi:hypothetical protein
MQPLLVSMQHFNDAIEQAKMVDKLGLVIFLAEDKG